LRAGRRARGARLAFGAVSPARFEQGLAIVVEEAKRLAR
jgi:hypothetical protein